MGMCILVVGDAVNGFEFYGPFNNSEEAILQAGDFIDATWIVAPLAELRQRGEG